MIDRVLLYAVFPLVWAIALRAAAQQVAGAPLNPPSTRPSISEIILENPVNRDARCYLDLDTGQTFAFGQAMGPDSFTDSRKWMRDNGVDLMCETRAPANGFATYDLLLVPVQDKLEDLFDYAVVQTRLRNTGGATPAAFDLVSVASSLPKTYLFKTREGNIGVLEFSELSLEPSGMRLRYRVIQKPQQPEREYPPGRGRRGVPVPIPPAQRGRGAPLPAFGPGPGRGQGPPSTRPVIANTAEAFLNEQIEGQEQQLQALRIKYGESYPLVVAARKQLEFMQKLSASGQQKQFDPDLADLQAHLLVLRESLARMETVYGPNAPVIISLRLELDRVADMMRIRRLLNARNTPASQPTTAPH